MHLVNIRMADDHLLFTGLINDAHCGIIRETVNGPEEEKNNIVQDFYYFLPREATRRAVLPRQVVRPSVRPSVCDVEVS